MNLSVEKLENRLIADGVNNVPTEIGVLPPSVVGCITYRFVMPVPVALPDVRWVLVKTR